ncbi:MAG: PKD domain-containing protein [Bacteroidales bacterium]|nr:PKD domain-containing protein [Bacteroidales bacterium]
MKRVVLSFCLLLALAQVFGQLTTNKSKLNSFSSEKANEFKAKKAEAIDYANRHNIPIIIESEKGLMELMYIDPYGQPQYYSTTNVNASATVSTDKVNSGGGYGYSLDGAGMTIHEWDAGGVLTSHQEYEGRAVQADNASGTHYHATHVAGTMIASGVVSSAKGMAPAASLRAFDWSNDESEMASEAANNNALVSNHSYGMIRGWAYVNNTWQWYGNTSVSTAEDYLFGFYDSQAQSWDNIAYNAPYYLIVRSAGNDRNEGPASGPYPQDGPYDCISHSGIAKNILTVGSVADIAGGYTQPSDVIMTSYSSWGPADDGRIKPDIVANGSGLYSSDNYSNASYNTLSGTSMASPNAAGSMLLLQEHYENLHGSGNFMRAATLKAVVIHTADEAGTTEGPDYEFGWGLLNTKSAADLITDDATLNTMEELALLNNGTYQRTVKALGTEPLKVTIAWTDVPGTPVAASLDPTALMLVNDLDLRITESGNVYYPWKLDGTNPTAAATRSGENNADNVEVVLINNPVAGADYTIVVDHDGSLNGGAQAFSLVVSGAEPPPPVAPQADFAANFTTVFTGTMVTFNDLSQNSPTAWSWSFNPSTVTFVNGTDAGSRYPQVTFDAPGTYDVSLTVSNNYGSDNEYKTAYITVNEIQPVSLPWVEDFEGFAGFSSYSSNTSVIDGLPGLSYEKTENGRLRFNAGQEFCYSGNYAATLDASPSGTVSVNYLIATLNLSNYVSSTNLELSFMYMHHSEESHNNDRVWIRGSDTDMWIEAFDLYANQTASGTWKSVVQIDIDQLLADNGQIPGATFQLRFGQEDESPTLNTTSSDGYTFDDITIAEVNANAYIISSFPYSQSWENGEGLWMQPADDEFDWTWHSSTTPSGYTGPSGAHDGIYYMYTESSSPRYNGDEAFIEATFDFTALQNPELSFYYHMYGSTMGSLHVDVYDGTAWNNDVWFASGQLQTAETDPFEQAVVDLSAWGGQNNIMIRFRGSVGNGGGTVYYSDMAFDMIQVDGAATPQPPLADFVAETTSVNIGENVQFTELCQNNPTSYEWTFEGGTPATSTDQNPVVAYHTVGTFSVTLIATNDLGSDTEIKNGYITVNDNAVLPVADFTADNTSIAEGDFVQFTDLSTDATGWSWTFNGGTPATSSVQHPMVSYNTPGVYTVELTATNADGSDTETKIDYITVIEVLYPPVADFTANTTQVEEGGSVQFNDQSSNNPSSWNWSFEGANISNSTAQHPSVTYNVAGTYTVSLAVSNPDGTDTETKTGYITVNPALTQTELLFTDFESGWGMWTDGGNDCELHTSGTYAWGGNNAANIQDDSGIPSSFYLTNGIDVHTPGYVQLDVEFFFVATGMKNKNDKFNVEYYNGSSWQLVATFACSIDFEVGSYYKAVVIIREEAYTFPTDMKIRFMNAARKDDKDVYIDDIKIIGSTETVQTNAGLTLMTKALPLPANAGNDADRVQIDLYPNPAVNSINIASNHDGEMSVFIYNITGQQMYYGERLENHQVINVSNFENGLYVVKVLSDHEVITKRFLKQ